MTSLAFDKAIGGGGGSWDLISYNAAESNQYYLAPVDGWKAGPAASHYSKIKIVYSGQMSGNFQPWFRVSYSNDWDGVSGNRYIYSGYGYAMFGDGYRGTLSSDPYNNYNNITSQVYFTNALTIASGSNVVGEFEINYPTVYQGYIFGKSRCSFFTTSYNDEMFVDMNWWHGNTTTAIQPGNANYNTIGIYIANWQNFTGTWTVYGLRKGN